MIFVDFKIELTWGCGQYVTGSTINCENLKQDKPGDEGFYARCILLQKTSEHEIYLYDLLNLVLFILNFVFQVSYVFAVVIHTFGNYCVKQTSVRIGHSLVSEAEG